MCTPPNCQCVEGKCQNRTRPTTKTAFVEDNEASQASENSTVMAPPPDVARILRPKRKTRVLQLNLTKGQEQEKRVQPSCALNETYDLGKQSFGGSGSLSSSSEKENEEEQLQPAPRRRTSRGDESDDDIPVGSGVFRHLWPKHRVSFFPSPSLLPDL